MDYQTALNYIHSTPKFARTLGNEMLKKLLFYMGNPHKKLKFIHIAGTNGKGSTAIMLSEILQRCGYKIGLFTSPYLECFNERIKVNGENISDDTLAEITEKIKKIIELHSAPVTEFALDTAIAFEYFLKCKCDIVILETGLGGRLDATNVIESDILSIITSIGYDHTKYLGDTIEKITAEKCGIIKNNGNVACYPDLCHEAMSTVEKYCGLKNANLVTANMPKVLDENSFVYGGKEYKVGMTGEFQKFNASLVICAVEMLRNVGYDISDDALNSGLLAARNPGRMEELPCGLWLDGAHNVSAAEELVKSLKAMKKKVSLCVAMMSDKDISGCVKVLSQIALEVIATEIDMPRCASAESISEEFALCGISTEVIKNPVTAVEKLLSQAFDDRIVVACGSLYLVGELRKKFGHCEDK